MGVRNVLTQWLNAGFDPATTDPLLLRRARGITVGVGALLLMGPPYVLQYALHGRYWTAAAIALATSASVLNLVLLWRERRVGLSGLITLICLALLLLWLAVDNGGFYDTYFGALYLLPLAAFTWLGRRAGLIWTGITVTIVVGFWWMAEAGTAVGTPSNAAMSLAHRVGAVIAVAVLALTALYTHEHSERRLAEDRRRLRAAVEQSQRAEHQAEQEARAQSAFVATVSHELRTPMTAALGSADLLMETELSAEQRRLVQTIHHSGQALLDVIDDILDFSKIEANALTLEEADFSLRQALEAVGEMLAPLAHNKGLELMCELSPDLPERVRGDAGRVRQVVLNLMSNALKFTREGSIVLRAHPDREGRVAIEVQDSGVGLTAAQASRIFDAFAQADASTARTYGGTGLGLTIARRLAQLMDGDIRVESEPGRGCTFHVDVALAFAEPARVLPPLSLPRGALVVDEHPQSRAHLERQLDQLGVQCTLALDADSAVALLRSVRFDVVLVDAELSDAGASRVHSAVGSGSRCVLLVSPGVSRGIQSKLLPEVLHLHKPVRRDALRAAVSTPEPASARADAVGAPAKSDPQPGAPAPLVLVADDNPTSASLARQIVERHGYRCEVAVSGRAVLERVEKGGVSMVLMDCQMPDLDGFQAARRLRKKHGHLTLPIVALTAHALEADRKRVLDAGMDDCLTKPYTLASLQDVLQRWCPLPDADPGSSSEPLEWSQRVPSAYRSALEQLRTYMPKDHSPAETEELLDSFVKQGETRLAQLRAALDAGHTDSMQREAHALRGSLGFLGQLTACDHCTAISTLTLPQDESAARQCVERLERVLQALGRDQSRRRALA